MNGVSATTNGAGVGATQAPFMPSAHVTWGGNSCSSLRVLARLKPTLVRCRTILRVFVLLLGDSIQGIISQTEAVHIPAEGHGELRQVSCQCRLDDQLGHTLGQ